MTYKNPKFASEIKEIGSWGEDDEGIVSGHIPQDNSENSYKSIDHIIVKSSVIPILICQTGYTSPTIVHSLENSPQKKDRWN